MLKEFDDVGDLSRCIKQLEKQNLSVGVILETAEKYGREGLEWLVSKSKLGLTDDLVRKLLKVDDLNLLTDDVIKAIKNSNGYADEIVEYVITYGEPAVKCIGEHGDEAVKLYDLASSIRGDIGNEYPIGNVGVSISDIHGVEKEIKAYSKYNNIISVNNISGYACERLQGERIYKTLFVNSQNQINTVNAYDRSVDTESKILEEIAHKLGYNKFKVDESVTGTIYIFTERKPCLSCEGVINKFKEMFPNIKLFIIYQYD